MNLLLVLFVCHAASERLVLLGVDEQELRDYGMLLFHAGLYGRSFEYLNAYSTSLVKHQNVYPHFRQTLIALRTIALVVIFHRFLKSMFLWWPMFLSCQLYVQANSAVPAALSPLKMKEDVALERLLERLRLILAEQAWLGTSGTQFGSSELPPDPW